MKLSEIVQDIQISNEYIDCNIDDIAYDSRKAGQGIMFVCLVGVAVDGHNFANAAYQNGSRVFLAQKKLNLPPDAQVLIVENTRSALAYCSARFFGNPANDLIVVGITGTKGKTTTTHIIRQVLDSNGMLCGVIGTVGAQFGDTKLKTSNTTPESYELHKLFRTMLDGGCKAVAIEVSSLGLKDHRTDGINFDYAVFTNLYPDHIGGKEHESFEEYKFCKKKLFAQCKTAIMCADDGYYEEFAACCEAPIISYGENEKADFRLFNVQNCRSGSSLGVSFSCLTNGETQEYMVSIPGKINALNAICAVAITQNMGISPQNINKGLMHAHAKGRAEVVPIPANFSVIIDYAHNGISLESILSTMKDYDPKRIITVFGSVGGRAQLRRRELAEASAKFSDLTVVTIDDPDFESPKSTIEDITRVLDELGANYVSFEDRRDAVRYALNSAQSGDIVVLAGKGHEEFMKINGKKEPFSERQIIEEYFSELKNE